MKKCSPVQSKNEQLLRQYFRETKILRLRIFEKFIGLPWIVKAYSIKQVTICVTYAGQINQMAELECLYDSFYDN